MQLGVTGHVFVVGISDLGACQNRRFLKEAIFFLVLRNFSIIFLRQTKTLPTVISPIYQGKVCFLSMASLCSSYNFFLLLLRKFLRFRVDCYMTVGVRKLFPPQTPPDGLFSLLEKSFLHNQRANF